MKVLSSLAFAAIALPSGAALAESTTPLVLTYGQFEATIHHIDLEKCPGKVTKTDVFCRLVVANDELHVFTFSEDGESPLIGIETYPSDGIVDLLPQ